MEKRALVRRPSPRLAEGIVTHIDRSPVDVDLANTQWAAYVDALKQHGWNVIEVPAAPDCPDSVFIEDPVFVYGRTAVMARSGAPERRPETEAVEQTLRGLGYEIRRIQSPGTLDGGDLLKFGGTVWVGRSGRTNQAGIDQLTEYLAGEDVRVVPVDLTKVLHLKSAVTALPDGTIVGYEPLVDDPGVWENFLAVPEEPGAHVVLLDGKTVLMASSAPRTAELYRERGLDVVAVDISEYEKLEGCVTCLSVRLRS